MVNVNVKIKHLLYITIFCCFTFVLFGCKGRDLNKCISRVNNEIAGESYDRAIDLIDEGLDKFKNNQLLLRSKGIALMGLNDYEQAVECFDMALNLNKKHIGSVEQDIIFYKSVALSKLSKNEQAYELISSLAQDKKKKDVFLLQGMIALELGRKQDAVTAFDKAIEADEKDLEMYIDIFQALATNSYSQSGKDYLSQGIRIAQKADKKLMLGKLFYYNEEYELSIKALEGEMDKPEAKVYMAKSMYMQGEIKRAYDICFDAINNSKEEQLGEYYNIIGLYHMSNSEYKKAINSFNEGLELNDSASDCELRYNEAVAYEFLGDYSTARNKMEDLIKLYPGLENAKREFLFLKTR